MMFWILIAVLLLIGASGWALCKFYDAREQINRDLRAQIPWQPETHDAIQQAMDVVNNSPTAKEELARRCELQRRSHLRSVE